MILHLAGRTPIGQGAVKTVYRHPQDSRLIVKVLRDDIYRRRLQMRPIHAVLFPFRHRIYIRREYRAYLYILATAREVFLRHIPKCFGVVQTDKGDGIVSEIVCAADGSPAMDLNEYIRTAGVSPMLAAAIKEVYECVSDSRWTSYDIGFQNFLVAEIGDGKLRLMYCEYDHVPLLRRWFAGRLDKKRQRRLARFIENCRKIGVDLR